MRPEEIIALTISDINLNEMYININKRIRKGETDASKIKNPIKRVPVFQNLKLYPEELIKIVKKENV